MIIIGEKINGSIPSVAEAIANRDAEFIKDRARKQAEANATFIDWRRRINSVKDRDFLILYLVREIRLIRSFQLWRRRKIRTGRLLHC